MYTIERLQNLVEYMDVDNVDWVLAKYFLGHLNNITNITLSKCMQDTGVSKASIHRFYSRGGFTNYKALISVLSNEVHHFNNHRDEMFEIDLKIVNQLCDDLLKANTVMFYGKQEEINYFDQIKYFLIKSGITVLSLNLWNMETVNERINRLNDNDVLVIVDSSLRIQNMFEMTMNRSYLLNFEQFKDVNYKKYYLGRCNCDSYFGFKNVRFISSRNQIKKFIETMENNLIKKVF